MNKLIWFLICLMSFVMTSQAIYIAYEYQPRKAKIFRINPPVPDKPGVIYPVPFELTQIDQKYLIIDTDGEGNKSLRVANANEKALIDAPDYLTCYSATSSVWKVWASGIQTNFIETPITLPSNVFYDVIQPIRGKLVLNGYDPTNTNQTKEYIAGNMIVRSGNTTNLNEKVQLLEDGLILNTLFETFITIDLNADGVPEWESIWDAPYTQTYTNYTPVYIPVCD